MPLQQQHKAGKSLREYVSLHVTNNSEGLSLSHPIPVAERSKARVCRRWLAGITVAWISVSCECCVFSGGGLRDGLITRPGKSYRMWCGIVCDLETSRMRRPSPAFVCCSRQGKRKTFCHRFILCFLPSSSKVFDSVMTRTSIKFTNK